MEKERFVIQQTEQLKEMNNSYLMMLDYEKVLNAVKVIIPRLQAGGTDVRASVHGGLRMEKGFSLNDDEDLQQPLIGDDQGVFITHVAGTIDADEKERLKKLLFRATRGKALTYFNDYEVKSPNNGPVLNKSVYVVVFQEGKVIRERIVRICDSFMG